MTVSHGGDWAGFAAAYGAPPLDFSASISPLGLPDGVRGAILAALPEADRYPDPLCRSLRSALSRREGIPAAQILCGNGAADLIFRLVLARRPRRALVCAPCFQEYEAALETVSCPVERHILSPERGFAADASLAEAIVPGLDLVFLAQPGNPTGKTIPVPLLQDILERCERSGALLVVDECFLDFLERPEEHSMVSWLARSSSLVILRSFTKLYAMAGVRLGYALCGDPAFLERMARSGPPWAVSSLAQAAGVAALKEEDYVRRVRSLLFRERPRLQASLENLGFSVVPGEANYLLFRSPGPLEEGLARRGILIRSCGSFAGLNALWYRTAVRTEAENARLLRALKEVTESWRHPS